MHTPSLPRKTAALLALAIASSALASAQTAASNQPEPGSETVKLDEFVVSGSRASLISALETKRDKMEIVDSIVANDINKLPDYNVTDALQRITGIQILRDRGEGAGIAIRGLTQMETTLNGRETFTAGLGSTGGPSRTIDFADIPSEMVAAINVYKTAAANQIEGGIGGLVDMQTRKPFDFEGLAAVASVRLVNGDLVKKTKPQYSALVTDRIKLSNGGEIGALVNFTYQERAWREDQKSTGAPTARTNILAGQTVIAQPSTSENTVFGTRKRTGVNGVVQYRPTKTLELYGEAAYTKFTTLQDTHQINASGTTPVAGSTTVVPGPTAGSAGDLQKVTWSNAAISVLSFARDTHDWTKQFAGGAIWRGADLTLKGDISYTQSYNDLFFSGPFFAATAATFTQDLSQGIPATSVAGTNLLDPANYVYTGIAYRYRPYHGDLTAGTIDGTYKLSTPVFNELDFGLREGQHKANNKPGLIFADYSFPAASRPAATQFPSLVSTNTYGFMPGVGATSLSNFMTGVLGGARDVVPYRAQFGITTPLPATASPLTLWNIKETTDAAYLMGKFRTPGIPVDGNVGVRVVHTQEAVSGSSGTSAANAVPINLKSTYNSVLPSLNSRYSIQEDLFLRFSASKSITRPDFNQLSPSLTLVPNPVDPTLNQGSAGNPNLRPIKSDNFDVALEKYFSKTTSVYATLFYKQVDGFIISSRNTETWDGQQYLISRPYNSDKAKIKGFEVGYSQFFDFLPGWMRGLGAQANYTYVDSSVRNRGLETSISGVVNTPLQNLSKNSYNLIAMYENKKISTRVAYNWRDKFLSGQTNIAGVGAFPFYTKAYGWLDASFSYNFSSKLTLTLEATNLLKTKRESYYGVETRPQNVYINDRQISGVVTVRF